MPYPLLPPPLPRVNSGASRTCEDGTSLNEKMMIYIPPSTPPLRVNPTKAVYGRASATAASHAILATATAG